MPTEDFSISFEDLVNASPTPDTQDQSISFDDVVSVKGDNKTEESEPISFGSVVDEFSLDDPETLYNAIKRNPGQNYTDEQIDAYLTFASKKEFKPGKVLSSFTQGIGPAVLELGKGAYDILKQGYNLVAANRYSEKSKIMKEMGLTALEGAARGAYDLGMIGKIIGLNNSLHKTDYSQASPTSYSMGGHSQGTKQISYADFNEEDKSKVRRKFRDLNKILADRQAYTEGEQTIIGDVGIAASRSPESIEDAIEQADIIAGMIPPRAAETYSMLLGIEGAVPYVVGKLGVKPLQLGVAKGLLAGGEEVTSIVSDATRAIQKGVDNLRKPLPEGVTAGARLTDAPGAVSQVSQGLSSTLGAARRQLDNTSEPNIFMAMSRDVEFIRNNPTLAETARFLGHGVYNDFGVLSDLANRSRPLGRLMLSGTVGGTRSAIGGSIIALPTFDEEMIGQQMAASFATGFGFGGVGGALLHSKKRIDSLADDFMNAIGEENQTIIRTRMESGDEEVKLGKGDLARAQTALNFVRRVTNATAGDTDIDVVFWDGNNIEAVQKYLHENGVDQALKLDEVSENYGNQFENADADKQFSHVRGFQILNTRRAGAKPVLVYNLKTMTGSTMMHEIVHGMKRLDLYKGHFSEIESVAFDSSARDGDEPTKGLISDDELFEFYEQMLQRADPETAERIRQDDKELATKATPGTPQENAGYWVKTRMREEVLADMFESFLYDKEPLYITRAGLPENSGRMRKMFAPVARMMSLFIQKTTPEGFLSRQGYRRKGSQDPLAYDSPALEHAMNGLINYQNRLLVDEGKLVRGQVSEEPLGEVFKRTQIKKGTALAKSMESSLLVKHDTDGKAMYDSEGNIMLEDSQKIIRKKEKERANFFTDTFTSQYYVDDPNTKGKSALRYRPDDDAISGDYISDDAMEKLRNAPPSVMPKALLENLEILNDAAKTGRPVEMDYNARLYVNKKGRKTQRAQYSSKLGSSIRLVVPYSFYVSKTGGNLLVNNLELSHLNSKYNRIMGDPVRSKNITSLWGNSRKDFDRDLVKYFGNILDPGEPGPTGVGLGKDLDPDASIARKKANVLSAFLGFTKKDIDFKGNPVDQQNLLDQMNPERQDNLVHSRRLDAVNSVRLTDLERMPLSVSGRRMIQKNYDPGRLQQAYDEALEQDRNDPNLGEKGEQKARGIVRRLAESMGYTIPAFHGTQRIDRIGNKFLSSRATSGPMAFFTSSPEIAKNYSTSKSDTSIKEIPDWVDQFLVKSKGKMVPLTRMFDAFDRKLADNLSKVSMDEDGNIVMGDGIGGDWGYYMRDNGNNALKAAADVWLNSGYIYGEEAKFTDVLKTAGFKGEVIWDDPYAQKSGVVEAYLRLTNPIDVTKMSQADYDYLIRSVKGKRAKPRKGGADHWDKNDVSGEQFAERLKNDREDGTTWAWTAIPDFVTQALKERGYDGIIDTGGKGGGQKHEVYIPFYPSQIKSAQTVTRDKRGNIVPLLERFDQSTSDIRFDPGNNSSNQKGFWYNETDDQPAKQPSKETTQAFRWKQVAEELERRKSDEADAGSVEELVFGGREFDRSWFSPVDNMGEAAARMDAQDGHLLDWSQQNGYYIPKEDFEYAISTSSKGTLAGKEHRVFLTPDGNSVIKVTHNDQYGKPFKTASQYLQQMDDYNSVVSPDMQRTFIGITEVRPGVPAIVTGQSFVTGSKIVDEQIGGYMEKEGFEQLGSLYVYQHPSGIRIYDLHHENAVIGDDGKIKPYDIWVDIPRGDEIQKRFKPTRTMDEGKVKVYQNQEGYQAIEQEDGSVKIYEPTGEELSELFSNIIEAESHLLQVA